MLYLPRDDSTSEKVKTLALLAFDSLEENYHQISLYVYAKWIRLSGKFLYPPIF